MTDDTNVAKVQMHLTGDDDEQVDRLTRQLRDELRDLDVRMLPPEQPPGGVPDGAKALESIVWGVVVVEVALKSIPNLIDFAKEWTARGHKRQLKVTVENKDRKVTVEFAPGKQSNDEIKVLVDKLLASPGSEAAS
jgi:hypothetical protein